MLINIGNEPGICSLLAIRGFGGGIPQWGTKDTPYTTSEENYPTFESFVDMLVSLVDEEHGENEITFDQASLVMAACVLPTEDVTKGQPLTSSYFEKMGFTKISVPEYGKYDNGLVYFFMPGPLFSAYLRNYDK